MRGANLVVSTALAEGRFAEARRQAQPGADARWDIVLPVLRRLAQRWSDDPGGLAEAARRVAQARPSPDSAASYFRTFCYAWTTTARFMNPVADCHCCGQADADKQGHYLACRIFRLWLQRRAGWHEQPAGESMHGWLLLRAGMADPEGVIALVAIDVALSAFDARRGGSRSRGQALLDARLKEVCRRHRRAREAFATVHRSRA